MATSSAPNTLQQNPPAAPSPLATSQTPPTTTTSSDPSTFPYPAYTSFPPFYTLQPNTSTRARQLELWTALLLAYCAHTRTFRLPLTHPIFSAPALSRALKPADIRAVITHMSAEGRAEQVPSSPDAVWIWWRGAGEWADAVYGWVDSTGQKGAVLTVYELREEGRGKEWSGMEEEMLRKVLGLLVKRGKAQVFGESGEGEGVKFF